MRRNSLATLALTLTLWVFHGWGSPGVFRGNDTGGIIAWSEENERSAPEFAAQHCARWGKYARITSGVREPGNFINFICAHYYGQHYYGAPTHFWPPQPRQR